MFSLFQIQDRKKFAFSFGIIRLSRYVKRKSDIIDNGQFIYEVEALINEAAFLIADFCPFLFSELIKILAV